MNDSEWKDLMRNSPHKARHELIRQYGNFVYAIVINKLRRVARREDIEDCVSDVFVEIFQNTDAYETESGSLKGYISIIAKRTAIDTYRRLTNYQGKTTSIENEDITGTIQADISVEDDVEKRSLRELLWQKIRSLGEPDKTIIIQQFFYNKTAEEIAVFLSMTSAAVHKRSIRTRQQLKKMLMNES